MGLAAKSSPFVGCLPFSFPILPTANRVRKVTPRRENFPENHSIHVDAWNREGDPDGTVGKRGRVHKSQPTVLKRAFISQFLRLGYMNCQYYEASGPGEI